jgi:hypothetical protein
MRVRRAGVDRYDLGVGTVAAQEACVRLAVQIPIRGVLAASGYQSKIFAPSLAGLARVHRSTPENALA